MSKNKKKSPWPENHPKPVTRREFLSYGLRTFSAVSLVPTPFSMIRSAWADDCGGGNASYIPFLTFDCAGGAALPANFLVGGQGGAKDLLPSYSRLGWNPANTPDSLNEDFGLPMAKKESKILEGILASSSVEARKNLRMGSFCHFAQSDSSSNPLNVAALVAKYGYKGKMISQTTGMLNTTSGGNSAVAFPSGTYKALYVPSVQTLVDAVGIAKDSALGSLTPTSLQRLLETGKKISRGQIEHLAETVLGRTLLQTTECSYDENMKKVSGGGGVDPRTDSIFQNIYAINQNSPANEMNVVAAGIVKNVLSRTTGPGVITIGGCDYHNNDQAKSDAIDRIIGVQIGRAVQAAHVLKQPLFFQVITDGGCSNIEGTRLFVSDSNEKCMTVVGYYRPEGAVAQKRIQVGYYTDGQGAEKKALTGLGDSPVKVAASVFANYLSLHLSSNQLTGEFFKYIKSDLFNGSAEMEQTLFFGE